MVSLFSASTPTYVDVTQFCALQLPSIGIWPRGINGPGVALRYPSPPLQPQGRRGNEGINRTRSFRLFNFVCRFVLLGGGYHHRFSILQLLQLGSHCRPDSWESVGEL